MNKFKLLSILMLIAVMLSACGGGAAATEAPAEGGNNTLVFIPGSASNPSQAFGFKMFQKHAAEYNFDVSMLDGKADVAEQTKAINNAVAQGADVIIVNPNDALAIVPAMKAAQEAGVVVGIFMAAAAPGDSTFFVAVDDKQAGGVVVQGILDLFPDGATGVEIGGQAGHPAAIDRHDGFTTALADHPEIKVLDYQNPQQWDAAMAQAIAEDMVTKYGDEIQFVFCHWDNGATGVINALKAAGMEDVLVFGVDGNAVAFEQVQSWKNYNSIGQNVETIAMKSMEIANLFLAKDASAKFDNIVPFDLITKDTFGNFTPPEW
ncbi:MAG: sugar ABC transporter substrate-binding protein [Anaerolineales bacterium]|nr:sugar ABC transporter substrate-binding protein [Anaerolineales bacterium]